MASFILPHFGPLDLNALDSYYDVKIEFDGNTIQIDLNFDDKSIDPANMAVVKSFIERISQLDEQNKVYIKNDYNDEEGDTVKFYLDHHLEDISKDDLSGLIDFKDTGVEPELQLMDKLRLVRVGLYPDSEDSFATFDYSIDPELTNYLVVINTDKDGAFSYMTMES